MAARQDVEKAKEAVVNAEGKLALEEEEVRKREALLLALQQEVNHSSTPPPTVPADFVQELNKLQSFVQELQRESGRVESRACRSCRIRRGSPKEVEQGLSQRLHRIW